MQCPYCGHPLEDQDTKCPACGAELHPDPPAETPIPEGLDAQETDAAETPAQETDAAEPEIPSPGPEAPDPAPDTPPKKSRSKKLPVILGAVAGLLLIVVVCLTVVVSSLSKTGQMPGFVTALQRTLHGQHFDADAVAVEIQDQDGAKIASMNNQQLGFYYWGEFYYFIQSSGIPFDLSQPLDQQDFSEGVTWQDYFLDNATTSMVQVAALKADAEKNGFVMPEDYQAQYDSVVDSLAEYAKQTGFTDSAGDGDVLAYVQDSYGDDATVEDFKQYLYDSYFISAYSDALYAQQTATDAEIEQFYDDNQEMYETYGIVKSDQPNVNVRHILITPEETDEDATEEETQAAKDAARQEAQRILQEWKDGDATEESFGELANTYSTDPGSNTAGGLYEDVYPGQMVTEFNDWCFDPDRKPGDTAIVETDYGCHVMYFVGTTDHYYWKQTVESDVLYQHYNDALTAITSQYSAVTTDDLELITPAAVETLASQQAAQNAADSAAESSAAESTSSDNDSAAESSESAESSASESTAESTSDSAAG